MFVIRQPNTIIRYTLFHTSSYFCPSWFACGGLMKPISPFRNLALYLSLATPIYSTPSHKERKKRAYTDDIIR